MFQKDPTFYDTRSHFWQKWDFSLCITAISVVLVIDDICYSTCTALEQLIFSDNTDVYDVEKYFSDYDEMFRLCTIICKYETLNQQSRSRISNPTFRSHNWHISKCIGFKDFQFFEKHFTFINSNNMIYLQVMILLVAATDFEFPSSLQRYALSPKVRF